MEKYVFLFCFLLISSLFAQRKSLKEYWTSTTLRFDSLEQLITTKNCYTTEKHFVACMNAIFIAQKFNDAKNLFVPTILAEKSKDYIAEESQLSFNNLTFVSMIPKEDTYSSYVEYMLYELRLFKDFNDASKELFNSSLFDQVNFEELIKHINKIIILANPDCEAFISAQMYNKYLEILIDPHTTLAPTAQLMDDMNVESNTFYGIGIMLNYIDNKIVLAEVYKNGPAHKAGLTKNDVIVNIDGIDIAKMKLSKILPLLTGEKGSFVEILIERNNIIIDEPFIIQRDEIEIKNVTSEVITDKKGTRHGYLKIKSFMPRTTCYDVNNSLLLLFMLDVDSIILDLRGNPGGLVTQAVCVAGHFLAPHAFVTATIPLEHTESFTKATKYFSPHTFPFKKSVLLTTLIDSSSASASEIVAGVLQNYRRSIIIGTTSYGKGSVQNSAPISIFEGVILNQTIAKYYLPSGHTPQINGIKPDFEVFASPNPTDKDKLGIREKDLYAFLPNGGEEFKQEPEIIHTLNERQKCAEKTGFARLIYNSSTDLIKPDFQLLYAQDISNCFLDFFKKNKK